MSLPVPAQPKLYHILHIDRLASVLSDGQLLCDAQMGHRAACGSVIGMSSIKQRRLSLPIDCRPGLHVGECVPFYFCPRSIMLYLIYRANDPNLTYRGGEEPILHLEADMHSVVRWAESNGLRWAFTLSNAGANYFEDRCDTAHLNQIDWTAVRATQWSGAGVPASVKEGKQAEFLVEQALPWELIERIGVCTSQIAQQVADTFGSIAHRPRVEIRRDWYYP